MTKQIMEDDRIIEIMEPDPVTRRLVHTHDAFFKLVAVHASSYAQSCTVKVTNLSQDGQPCLRFVPSALRWFGRDGEGADCKSFLGQDFVMLLDRRPARPEWQLQAAIREGTGVRFWYEPGEYEVDLVPFESSRPGTRRWRARAPSLKGLVPLLPMKIIVDLSPDGVAVVTVGTGDEDGVARRVIETLRTTREPECYFPVLENLLKTGMLGPHD